jgi:hypothetical protein
MDASGDPLAEARVSVLSGPLPVPDVAALTDSGGRFAISVPAAGTYELAVAIDGPAVVQTTVRVEVAERATVEVRLDLSVGPD